MNTTTKHTIAFLVMQWNNSASTTACNAETSYQVVGSAGLNELQVVYQTYTTAQTATVMGVQNGADISVLNAFTGDSSSGGAGTSFFRTFP